LKGLAQPETPKNTAAVEEGLSIGVGPMGIPKYLDRPQIVTRAGGSKLELAEFDKWAGSLKDDISRVLAENLSVLLSTDRVVTFPWRGPGRIDYQVRGDIIRFDGELGKSASLIVRWMVLGGEQKTPLLMRKSSLTEPAEGGSYDALVLAQSRVLESLSKEIAEEIKALSR
jgi:uncharacterized lipoprotein YmbA